MKAHDLGKIMILFIHLLTHCFSVHAQTKVSFTTSTSSSYCMGVQPMPGEQEALNQQIRTFEPLFLYNVEKRKRIKEIEVKPGKPIELKPGRYAASFRPGVTKKTIDYILSGRYDAAFVSQAVNIYLITIDQSTTTLNVNYHNYCPWELYPDMDPAP